MKTNHQLTTTASDDLTLIGKLSVEKTSLWVYVCMWYVFVCVRVFEYKYNAMVVVWRSDNKFGSQSLPFTLFGTQSLCCWVLAGWCLWGASCLCTLFLRSSTGVTDTHAPVPRFLWILTIQTQFPQYMCSKCLTHWAISSAPPNQWIFKDFLICYEPKDLWNIIKLYHCVIITLW